jgi:hypothetical protein
LDPVNGSDEDNYEGSEEAPFKTWDAVHEWLPKFIDSGITIKILPGQIDWIYLWGIHVSRGGSLGIYADMQLATIPSGGPNTGVATGGTTKTLTLTGAGWDTDELAGKKWRITEGTHTWYSGRIVSNTSDTFTIHRAIPTPFDTSDVFVIEESTVLVQPPDDYNSPRALDIEQCSGGSIYIYQIDFKMNNHRYAYYCSYFTECSGITIFDCSFITGTNPDSFIYYGAMFQNCIDVQMFNVALIVPESVVDTYGSCFYASGPNFNLSIDGYLVDSVQCYYGTNYLRVGGFLRYRANSKEPSVVRTVQYLVLSGLEIDAKNKYEGLRLDGHSNIDWRSGGVINANGDGIRTYDYHAANVACYFKDLRIEGCSGNGINVGGNSVITISSCVTDPTNLNGAFGVKLRNGAKCFYIGANTISGGDGDVNGGDGSTNWPHGTPATDTTHLTRMTPVGS